MGEGEGVSLRDFVQVQIDELHRRLEESAEDRGRIREEVGARVPRTSFDLLAGRVEALERVQSRLFGGLAVITILLALLGVALRYLVG
jgi:hypothetical protein